MSKLPKNFFEPDYFPTKDEFMEYFMSINLNGDPDAAYTVLEEIFQQEAEVTPENKEVYISFGYIITKYNRYLSWWDAKFSSKEEKYIGKHDKKKTPGEFILHKLYLRLYSIERASRDNYIFSKLSFELLHKKLDIFNELIFGSDYKTKNKEEPMIQNKKPKRNTDTLISDDSPF